MQVAIPLHLLFCLSSLFFISALLYPSPSLYFIFFSETFNFFYFVFQFFFAPPPPLPPSLNSFTLFFFGYIIHSFILFYFFLFFSFILFYLNHKKKNCDEKRFPFEKELLLLLFIFTALRRITVSFVYLFFLSLQRGSNKSFALIKI